MPYRIGNRGRLEFGLRTAKGVVPQHSCYKTGGSGGVLPTLPPWAPHTHPSPHPLTPFPSPHLLHHVGVPSEIDVLLVLLVALQARLAPHCISTPTATRGPLLHHMPQHGTSVSDDKGQVTLIHTRILGEERTTWFIQWGIPCQTVISAPRLGCDNFYMGLTSSSSLVSWMLHGTMMPTPTGLAASDPAAADSPSPPAAAAAT